MRSNDEVQVYELTSTTVWIDENGIVCAMYKDVPSNLETFKETRTLIK